LTELYGEEFEKRYIELESDESVAKRGNFGKSSLARDINETILKQAIHS